MSIGVLAVERWIGGAFDRAWHSFWYSMNKHKRGARLVGLLGGLLAARLIALLLAARPDNPAINLLLTLTAPLTAPFQFLDQLAGQPQFGARLELATLAALALLTGIATIAQWVLLSRYSLDREDYHAQS